nr:retrovirus-related Pol polyprotein from transposon TNT 1-94 [Tanacetum cinerariifolium]
MRRHILLGLPVNDFKKILVGRFLIDKVVALEVLPADIEAQTKAELNKKAHSAVILCLGNKVLREVTGKTTAAGVWSKLETLYMTKRLANKLYPKKKLYTFYMPTGRKIYEHIDEFNKIVLDLANIEVKFKDEDLALLLLTSLPASYGHLALWTGSFDFGGRDGHTKFKGNQRKRKSRLKSRGGRLKCYICHSEDHLKRNCPKNNRKKSTGYVKKDEKPSSSGLTYDDSEVMMVMSAQAQALLDWIMDSGCSYHMTPRLDILFDFLECDRGSVQLGNNRECKIRGIGKSGKVKVINGSRVILSGIRRNNCVYSLDGHAMAGELNASVEEKIVLRRFGTKDCDISVRWDYSFGVERHTTQGVIYYVHSDLWGPSQVESLEGKRYFLSIVDDYSNKAGRTVKKLRTDNGLEFYNREFEQLCIESGIARHLTVAGTLQQYGCVAYPQDKLEPRAVKFILLGYPEGVKGYRLYRLDGESPKIVTRRNVVFNKSVMYKDTLKDSGAGDKSVEELQVEVELQRLNNHMPEEDQTDREDGDDEDAWDQATDQPSDLTDYQLVQDREPMTRTKPFRYKERLVARGFTQRAGIDYNKVFSPVVRHTSIRIILALTACKDYELEQLDVKMTFLHGNLEEVIYMKQPSGYEQGVRHEGTRGNKKDSWYGDRQGSEQSGYASKILNNFRIDNGKSVKMPLGGHFKMSLKDGPVRDCDVERMRKVPYANAVGSLMYLMVCTVTPLKSQHNRIPLVVLLHSIKYKLQKTTLSETF